MGSLYPCWLLSFPLHPFFPASQICACWCTLRGGITLKVRFFPHAKYSNEQIQSPAHRPETRQTDQPFHHNIRSYQPPLELRGRLQERQTGSKGCKGDCFIEYTKVVAIVLCIHLVGKYLIICFSNRVWAISGMTKHNLTPCQAQYAAINLICFPALPDCFSACWGQSSLIGKLAETCPADPEAR